MTATTSPVVWSASTRTSRPGRPGQPDAAEVDPRPVGAGVVDVGQVVGPGAAAGRDRRVVVGVVGLVGLVGLLDRVVDLGGLR